MGFAAVGLSLLALFLFLLLRTDPLQKEIGNLTAQEQQLGSRLIALRSKPTAGAGVDPVAGLKGLAAHARELETRIRRAADAGDADGARSGCQQLAELVRNAAELRQSARRPGVGTGTVAVATRQEIIDGEALARHLENLRVRAASKPAFAAQCETLNTSVQETLAGFRKLLKEGRGHPPDEAELARLTAAAQASLTSSNEALANMPPPTAKPVAPFDEKDATMVIGCSSDLAASLLIPLLHVRTDGKVVTPETGKWYYTAGAGGSSPERILVRLTGDNPLAELFHAGVDLVVTERDPGPDERAAFAQAFPGSDLGSRATAEVVALDALTFLVQPDSAVQVLGTGDLKPSRNWVGGAVGSPEQSAAERFGFKVTQPVDGPVADAMLGRPEGVGLGVYHLEGTSSRARQLPCQTGTLALRPSPFTIATEDYKYSYRIVAYQNPHARPDSSNLVRFITSDKGQETVATQGYVDLRLHPSSGDVDPVILATLAHALGFKSIRTAVRLSTNFRFRTGVDHLDLNHVEAALDLKAQADLVRLPIDLARGYPRAKVVILGFTDTKGTAGTNQPLSLRRAEGMSALLKQAGVEARTAGLSDQLPVDSNDTEEGRARNRRCEVWVVPD